MILDIQSQLLSFPLRFAVLTVCLFCCLRADWNFTTNKYTGETQANSVSVMILCQLFVCYSWEDDLEVMQLLSQGFWKYIVRQCETDKTKRMRSYTLLQSLCTDLTFLQLSKIKYPVADLFLGLQVDTIRIWACFGQKYKSTHSHSLGAGSIIMGKQKFEA